MKLKNTVGILVSAAMVASAAPAMAQYAGSVEASAFAKRYDASSSRDLDHGGLVGGTLGYFVTDDVLLNIGLGTYSNLEHSPSGFTPADADGRLSHIEAVYHFGQTNIRPYLSGGFAHQ